MKNLLGFIFFLIFILTSCTKENINIQEESVITYSNKKTKTLNNLAISPKESLEGENFWNLNMNVTPGISNNTL